METSNFFKTSQGQQFLSAFDYQKNAAAGVQMIKQAPPSQGIMQTTFTDAKGNVINGQQGKQLGNVKAAMDSAQGAARGGVAPMATYRPTARPTAAGMPAGYAR